MGLRFCPLFSGSDGNCCFLEVDNRRYLIDAGFSGKKIESNLKILGIDPSTIDLIFLTHEHIDHIRGAGVLSRRYDIKICKIKDENIVVIGTEKKHRFSLFDLYTLEISHDCARGMGFVFNTDYGKVSLLTDTGIITNHMKEKIKGSKIFYFEANHDLDMLKNGPYDYNLKQRILGEFGHISNVTSGNVLSEVVTDKCKKVYLGHLSETNNEEKLAYDEVFGILNKENLIQYTNLEVAKRFDNSSITEV